MAARWVPRVAPFSVAPRRWLAVHARASNVEVCPAASHPVFRGGFVQLGLPLSRWFNADPRGHNAGWQLLFTIGKDQVNNHDLNNPGFVPAYNGGGTAPLPMLMGKTAIGTVYYKFNNWCQFAFEQSVYATRMKDGLTIYTIAGQPSNEWQDQQTGNSGRFLRF